MEVGGFSSVGQILSNQSCVESVGLQTCNLSPDQLQAFKSSLGNNTEIRNLQLDGNENMGVEGSSSVGQILSNQSCVGDLSLHNCNLSSDQLQAFKSSLGNNTEIKQLWLKGNASMGVEGLSSVGQILSNQSCVESVGLQKCNLSPDQLQAFKSSLGNNTEIEYLDLDEERIANHEDIVAIANLLPNITERLLLYDWKIAVEDKKILQNQLDKIRSEKLKIRLGEKTLKSQRKPADKATNVTLKQNPTLSSESEFGATSQISNSESTEENMEISKEAKSPRSELLMTEKEAEQSDKEVTEQAAKLTQPSDTSSRTAGVKRRRTSDGDSGSSPRSKIPTTEVEEIQQKNELSLYELLKNDIQEAKDTYDLVEVFHKHRGDKKEVISEVIKNLSIKHYNLNDANIKVFITTILKLDKLEMLNVQKCGNSEYLNKFFEKLEMTNCKIAKISIWGMKELKIYSQSLLRLLKKSETESLMIQACELEKEDVDQLLKDIKSFKKSEYSLRALALSHNSKMGLEDFQKFGEILHILPVKTISLFDCDLTDDKLSNLFASSIKQISTLDVSGNTEIMQGFKIIGQMSENSELRNLLVRCCELDKAKLKSLQSSCKSNARISNFDVSYNETLGSEGMAELGRTVVNFGVKNLNIAGCKLNKKLLEAFRESTEQEKIMISRFDVSYNETLGAEGMAELGRTVVNFGVKNLNIAGCKLNKKLMEAFKESIEQGELKVEELNISCNPNLEQGIVEVASLLENNCMKKLDLSNCMLSTETICDLSSALKEKNIQVETLNISENDPTFIVTRHHAEAVCELLKNVSKELIFELQSMQPQVRKTLQHGLEELANEKETMVILWKGDILRPEKSQAQLTTTSLK